MTAPNADLLARLQALYDANRYVDAHALASEHALLRATAVDARVFAGRLVANLGGTRLATAFHFYTHRKHPRVADAAYYYGSSCKSGSPFTLLEWMARVQPRFEPASPRTRSHWLGLQARAHADLRDFERAGRALESAKAEHVDAWLLTEEADVLTRQDQRERALEIAHESLRMQPGYRPSLHVTSALLAELGRLDEAIELLERAVPATQSGALHAQLGHLQSEAGRFLDALGTMQRALALQPLLESGARERYELRIATLAHLGGDGARARALAAAIDTPMGRELLADLSRDGRRVQVPVPFVRQHHLTCAPATLAAIARYWKQDVDHTALAAEICYGGTSDHGERAWAERNGFQAHEFRVTIESTRALVDRGVPFTLSTLEVTSGHLQAVFGYDTQLQRLLVRDPSLRHSAEYDLELIEHYASCGPRGMVLLPAAEASRLAGVELPDVALYDQLFEVKRCLQVHARRAAGHVAQAMAQSAPAHRLTRDAELRLAMYDQDLAARTRATEALLALHPDDERLALSHFYSLRQSASREKALAFVESFTRKPGAAAALVQAHADELRSDPRAHLQARTLLRSALRANPSDAASYHILGDACFDVRRYAEGVELYRAAACLDDVHEHYALEYFRAARVVKDAESALRFLAARAERYLRTSGSPATTYFAACEELERPEQGQAMLERALAARPQDGELLLFCAEVESRYGRIERARELLAQSDGHARAVDRLTTQALIASRNGETEAALAAWQAVIPIDPLHGTALRSVALGLLRLRGVEAALAHLAALRERFPDDVRMWSISYDVAKDLDAKLAERCLREMITLRPHDTWALRELGFHLLGQGREDDAQALVERLRAIGDDTMSLHALAARCSMQSGQLEAARTGFRRAIAIDVDFGYAINSLLECCTSLEQRRTELDFVRGELVRQVTFGQGIQAFRAQAQSVLADDAVLEVLREGHAARPDLPDAWSALAEGLLVANQVQEAQRIAEQMVERFPALEDAWLLLARVQAANDQQAARRATLERARERLPASGAITRALAIVLAERGAPSEARAIMERWVTREPGVATTHGVLALALYRDGAHTQAIERLQHALRIDHEYGWAWDKLEEWSTEAERPDAPVQAAEALVAQRPFEASAQLRLGECLLARDRAEAALAAFTRAVELEPQNVGGHDLRARVLTRLERFDEAIAATEPEALAPAIPHNLRGRRAWIQAERGRLQDAIAEMRAVLVDFPDYRWGWSRLSDWCESLGDRKGQAEATGQLVRLAPHDAIAHGYHADALSSLGDRAGAKRHFTRAFALDPSYAFGALRSLDLFLEDGELEPAARALAALPTDSDQTLTRAVALEVKRGDLDRAVAAFRALCAAEVNGEWPQRHAAELLIAAGREADVDAALLEVLGRADAQPPAGSLWTERAVPRLREALAEAQRLTLGPAGRRAVASLIETCCEDEDKGKAALRVVRRHQRWLALHAETWGAVGYALVTHDRTRECVAFMSDYATRGDAQPWMLHNLVWSLQSRGAHRGAAAVARAALELPADHTRGRHVVLVALDEALYGDRARARALLRESETLVLEPGQVYTQALARIALWATHEERRQPPYRELLSMRLRLIDADRRAGVGKRGLLPRQRARTVAAIARGRPLHQQAWIRGMW